MKFLTILKSFFRSSRFGRVLTAIELLVGLTILFYYADRIIMFRQTTVYYEQVSNLAVYPDDNDAAADADKRDITRFANEYQVPTCFVRSNFAKLFSNQFDKQYAQQQPMQLKVHHR